MQKQLSIRLSNGSVFDAVESEWHSLAGAVQGSLLPDGVMNHLDVRRHDDGRILVYAVISQANTETVCGGELLPAGSTEVNDALFRVASRFGLAEYLLTSCVDQLRRA